MNEDMNARVNDIEWVYCIVGNIVEQREHGQNKEIRYGTKHFTPGTKIYCLPHLGYGGMGWEEIVVMGKPRKQFKLIKIVIRRRWITNFRLQKVWDKRVIKEMEIFDQESNEANKKDLLQFINFFNETKGL